MGAIKLALAFAAIATLAIAAKKKEKKSSIELDEGVMVLTADNFDAALAAHEGGLLVEFYAPWCGHCKKLAPEYVKAAAELKADGVSIAKMDASEDANKPVAEKYQIQGFPTLKWFKNGEPTEYGGGRDATAIVSWIRKKLDAKVKAITTVDEAKALQAKGLAAVAFVTEGSPLALAFAEAFGSNDEFSFASCASDEVRALYGVAAGAEAVVSLNNFEGEDNHVLFAIPADAASKSAADLGKEINAFLNGHALPALVDFSQEIAPRLFRGTIKTHYLLFAEKDTEAGIEIASQFRATAQAFAGKVLFVRVAPSEDRVMQYFDVTAKDLPTAVLVSMPADSPVQKFPHVGSLVTADFSAHVQGYLAGTLKAKLKSAPAPDAATFAAEAVKTVVGETFADVVLDADKDVLFEVYAPWCGHCKTLEPTYTKLGEAVKASGAKNIVIAKMDGTANDILFEGVNIKGFPTILFFKAGEKKAVTYSAGQTVEEFIAYLKENAVHGDQLKSAKAAPDAEEEEEEEEESHDDSEL